MNAVPERIIQVKTPSGMVAVSVARVVYVEVFDKVSIIHTEKRELQTYTSLDAICELLDSDAFLRVQRSYVVNIRYIESFLSDRVILQNGAEFALSRTNRQELKSKYQRFLFDLARGDTR